MSEEDRDKIAAIIAKVGPGERIVPEPTMPIMFLGGVLDHTVRQVPHALGRPTGDTVTAREPARRLAIRSVAYSPGQDIVRQEHEIQTYKLHQGRAGRATWWLYVLVGYDPPRRHFLDTMPTSAASQL